ncbi:MAG: DUF4124 domain-containing protein [Pseudomonadota bacterium]
MTIRTQIFAIGLTAAFGAHAGTLYRCVEKNGKVTYSDLSCKANGKAGAEKAIAFPEAPPPSAVPPPKPLAKPIAATPAAKLRGSIKLFYDPFKAPREHPTGQMESLISRAAAAWSAGCAVDLQYSGIAPYVAPGNAERVSIRWSPELRLTPHPANGAPGMGGTGSMESGVALHPRLGDNALLHVLVHEIGHVLGVSHIHEDNTSVMSYLPHKDLIDNVNPSAADYLACNRAMKKRFGIVIDLPEDTQTRKISDAEALEYLRRNK